MSAAWVLIGIVTGWWLISRLTGFTSPWKHLWHWVRGHPIKASVVIVSILLLLGQLVFGWWRVQSEVAPPWCWPDCSHV